MQATELFMGAPGVFLLHSEYEQGSSIALDQRSTSWLLQVRILLPAFTELHGLFRPHNLLRSDWYNDGVVREWVRLFCVGGPEGSRRGCERHGEYYLTRRRRGEEGDGGGSLTGGAIPSA